MTEEEEMFIFEELKGHFAQLASVIKIQYKNN